jgi:hypothetical protein
VGELSELVAESRSPRRTHTIPNAMSWDTHPLRLLLSWPAPKVEYALARTVGIGQARRWCTLSELSRLKQSKFTI